MLGQKSEREFREWRFEFRRDVHSIKELIESVSATTTCVSSCFSTPKSRKAGGLSNNGIVVSFKSFHRFLYMKSWNLCRSKFASLERSVWPIMTTLGGRGPEFVVQSVSDNVLSNTNWNNNVSSQSPKGARENACFTYEKPLLLLTNYPSGNWKFRMESRAVESYMHGLLEC